MGYNTAKKELFCCRNWQLENNIAVEANNFNLELKNEVHKKPHHLHKLEKPNLR